jgi:vacuolar protein sorting-associated protein 33A
MSNSHARPVTASKDADIILPPASALNPFPALPAALRIDNRDMLLSLLQSIPGRQLLVFGSESLRTLLMRQVLSDPHARVFKGKKNWDPAQFFPLPRGLQIVGTKILPDKISQFNSEPNGLLPFDATWDENIDVVTYFLRPASLTHTMHVSHRIKNWKSRTHHRIVYLPQATAMCHKVLSNLGINSLPNVTIHRLQADIFPLESDLLSLEYPDAMKECEVEGTPSSLISTMARSLLKIQDIVGTIPRLQSLGPLGEEVVKKMMTMRLEEHLAGQATMDTPSETVAAMMIIDRKVDMLTPMLTPLTYEGLLDEVVGIDCGFLSVNVQVINPDDTEPEQVALGVNGSDSLYMEVRDQHVEKFGSFLQNQAKALQQSHANFTNKETKKDLDEIHQFVKQIPIFTKNLRSLTNHIHLAELVKAHSEESSFRERWQTERSMVEGEACYDTMEELIATQYPPLRILKLLALQSLTGGGIKSAKYDSLRRDVVQTYGYEYMFVLNNLEKAGLVRRRDWMDSAAACSNIRKAMILINAEVDPVDPDDISYVSSGYAPLSVRLLQTAIKGWNGKDEFLKDLPGRLVDVVQESPPQEFKAALTNKPTQSLGDLAKSKSGTKKPTIIMVYVGGVTYMEIAALRFLSKRASFPYHIVIVTTKVVNGTTLLESLTT